MLHSDQFIQIWGFMRKDMKLEKTELLVYAVIYSFCKNCESFGGSNELLSQWTGSSISAVRNALDNLLEMGYIRKRKVIKWGRHYIEYDINISALPRIGMHAVAHKLNDEMLMSEQKS